MGLFVGVLKGGYRYLRGGVRIEKFIAFLFFRLEWICDYEWRNVSWSLIVLNAIEVPQRNFVKALLWLLMCLTMQFLSVFLTKRY